MGSVLQQEEVASGKGQRAKLSRFIRECGGFLKLLKNTRIHVLTCFNANSKGDRRTCTSIHIGI